MNREERIKELEEELKQLKEEVKKADFSRLDKYLGKYLYFEGYENGSVICRIDKFNINEEGVITFDGRKISLNTENCYTYAGVCIKKVGGIYHEDCDFEDFPYFENAYEFEKDDSFDTLEGQIEYFDNWLSYGEYGESVTGTKNSRELKPEKVLEVINKHLSWYLPKDITGASESLDDEII